ncbi:VOC family protein [Pseudorhizobium pelagicum]|uniref:PhnB-like domain-containing protein n=1 Tax=Pseudorhizobium pelagicum TaxID=1509405 RepID=A0A922NZF9_9HYPH|nr:VOC family protein [Pseudorhizobium pelagicum]KEQ03242.1 hypothetical protein GV67_14035 [Pseudorhizobium pelagicum]KEQ05188.1 hypothetical protein GV68_11675 [Pseudorhizobium pelagicum]
MKATPFLMFQGRCEEAINFYVNTIPGSEIEQLTRYGDEHDEMAGKVFTSLIRIAGQTVMANDSPPVHQFTFTPSFSFWIDCTESDQVAHLAEVLSVDGKKMMPADNYGFSESFAFVEDRFGISWQLCYKLSPERPEV